ncbi:dual specificity phosphatase [Coniochaeta ligniaria NRRL 30616]|uniref:Dual specificity phosphatase n=1 Tax=Coniochaeta ligniaria NRRL 30616 TaxID=1408157 RepID=A0A1J7JK48_9PEZI|nr:dual specificity phosphatase [Coniochaeta ligniaria NRRL 30616]
MATIALPRPIAPHRSPSSIGPLGSPISLDAINAQSASQCPVPVPNKHIPTCPPGPVPNNELSTPPPSPAGQEDENVPHSLLFPPDNYARLQSGPHSIYRIDAGSVAAALDHLARQPLPDPSHVFPWFHGLHPNNHIQQTFFISRRRSLRRTPACIRGITLVKADGDLTSSRLKGAIAPQEFLQFGQYAEFVEADPTEGFSVRNFHIQAAKAAMTSDIIVYGDNDVVVRKLGWDIAAAQNRWREKHDTQGHTLPEYNTFICVSPFSDFEDKHQDIVAVDSAGHPTGAVIDLTSQERAEMYAMAKSSEISHNVWLGPTPDPGTEEEHRYDILVECTDLGRLNPAVLQAIADNPDEPILQPYLDFPSSGSILAPSWSHSEADGILETCKWLYHLAHGTHPSSGGAETDDDGDSVMGDSSDYSRRNRSRPQRTILIHCADGYTESTMLGIAYYSFSTGRPVPDAWLNLHTTKRRNFFAYTSDVALLSAIAPRLLHESPVCAGKSLAEITALINNEPKWFAGIDGSFPSRITDYMYLGNLTHANNPSLLKALGITQILSVGETAMWRDGELEEWGTDNVCLVQGVQDNGIDPLTDEFERCLEFIDRGRQRGTATLVHCRVGVSRSATIVIAEVMRSMNMSFPRAYCFVRARRLNVIIQPHLRFAYELLKWEEVLKTKPGSSSEKAGVSAKRELEWGEIAREIALMNRPYAR